MHSLVGYGSDDDLDESPPPRRSAWQLGNQIGFQSQTRLKNFEPSQVDVNYEEVQMDLSEDSNASGEDPVKSSKNPENTRLKDEDRNREEKRDRYRDSDRNKSKLEEDKSKFREEFDKNREKGSRGDYGERDHYRRDRDEKQREKDRRYRDDKGREDKHRNRDEDDKYRDRDKGRDYRDKYRGGRSSSRDRRSRSPRRSDYRRRSRSGSRDRGGKPGYSRRYDRGSARMGRIEKLGIDLKASIANQSEQEAPDTNSRFYMPGITGRFTEQIQRRKMLWQKNKEQEKPETATSTATEPVATTTNPKTGKLWETTTFTQDQDGKVANKFKRLMGIRDNAADGIKPTSELIKKQEEMFTSMEAQYEVARTATHTMRGVGLGFGSFQR